MDKGKIKKASKNFSEAFLHNIIMKKITFEFFSSPNF